MGSLSTSHTLGQMKRDPVALSDEKRIKVAVVGIGAMEQGIVSVRSVRLMSGYCQIGQYLLI